VTFCDIPVLT